MIYSADKYINPFTDFGFKKLFGTEVNKDLLMDFLNELIHSEGKIKEVNYLNSEQLGRSEEDRRAVYDIYCKTETGETFIVEMQKVDELETRFEKWMYVLKNLPKLQELPSQLQERIFEKIFRVAEIAKLNRQEIAEYEDSLKRYRDLYSALETAELKGKIDVAKKAIEMRMSIDVIIELTGLSEEQIKELIKTKK